MPSSENSTRFTAVGNSHVLMFSPVWQSQSLIVLSAEPLANILESGEISTLQIAPRWPWNVPSRSPFDVYHAEIFLSFDTENSKSPSLLYLICVSARSCQHVSECGRDGGVATDVALQ